LAAFAGKLATDYETGTENADGRLEKFLMKNFLSKTKVTMKLRRYFQPFRIIVVLIFDGEVKYIREFCGDSVLVMNIAFYDISKYPTRSDGGGS